MKFAVQPQVRTKGTANGSPFYDKFFIHAKPEPTHPDTVLFLHHDGVWRSSTFFEGKPTGYFESGTDAETLLASIRLPKAA